MKLAAGSIRRRCKNGCFAYRCQGDGRRTEISLQTRNYLYALKKVAELVPSAQARTAEVIAAHVNKAHGFATETMDLALADYWDKYALRVCGANNISPNRRHFMTMPQRNLFSAL